jgi:hypothetical protein
MQVKVETTVVLRDAHGNVTTVGELKHATIGDNPAFLLTELVPLLDEVTAKVSKRLTPSRPRPARGDGS